MANERVFWTRAERQLLAKRLAELRLDDPVPALASLLPRAQREALQPERIRHVSTINAETELICMLMDLLKKPQDPTATTPIYVPSVTEKVVEVEKQVEVEIEVPTPIKDIGVFTTSELLEELFLRAKWTDAVETAVSTGTELEFQEPVIPEVLTDVAEETLIELPEDAVSNPPAKMLIAGLPPKHARRLEERLRRRRDLNLKLVFLDRINPRDHDLPKADYAVVGKLISAQTRNTTFKNRYGSDRMVFVTGGPESIEAEIDRLIGHTKCGCGDLIPFSRLQAIPGVKTCLKCAMANERH